jgi:hypothetical protein
MRRVLFAAAAAGALLLGAAAANATTYTSDTNLSDFATASSTFATISNAGNVDAGFASDYATLVAGLRVWSGGSLTGLSGANNWILAGFGSATADIRVFPNIDHFGSQYDGYQYTIEGSNDLTNWTFLFDSLSVVGATEPFTLGGHLGTAPSLVNNVGLGNSSPGGQVGYIADFHFGNAYQYYAFGASSVAFAQGNADQELTAVTAIGAPEPATWGLMLVGFGGLGAMLRAQKRRLAYATA